MADLVVVETDYGWIASNILNSQALTSNKKKFYDALENPSGEMADLDKQAFFDGGSYTFFTSSLSKWKSRNSKAATFVMLRDILIEQGFNDEATKLVEEVRKRKGVDLPIVVSSNSSDNNPECAEGTEKNKVLSYENWKIAVKNVQPDHFSTIITKNSEDLYKTTSLSVQFLDKCVQEHILADIEAEEIEEEKIDYKRNRKFYKKMMKKDINAFIKLIGIMQNRDTKQNEDIVIKTLMKLD